MNARFNTCVILTKSKEGVKYLHDNFRTIRNFTDQMRQLVTIKLTDQFMKFECLVHPQ